MKINQIVNEGIKWPVWVDDVLAKVGIKTASYAERKIAEAIARELVRIEPFIEKLAVDYTERVFVMRSKGYKDLDLKSFIKQNDTRWTARPIKEQEAILVEVNKRFTAKIEAKVNPPKPGEAPTPAVKDKEKVKKEKKTTEKVSVKEELAELEATRPGLRQRAMAAVANKKKLLGISWAVLTIWGIADLTIEFLQDSALVDQAMVDENNPLSDAEANILHQRVQANFYMKLATIGLAQGFIKAIGLAAGAAGFKGFAVKTGLAAAGGGTIAWVLANETELANDERIAKVMGGVVTGATLGTASIYLVRGLFDLIGPNALKIFFSFANQVSAVELTNWLTTAQGREFTNGIVRWLLEAPGGAPEDRTALGSALNQIRGWTPEGWTDTRRGMYKMLWDLVGPDSTYGNIVELFPEDIQKWFNLNPSIPPVGRGTPPEDYKVKPGTVPGVNSNKPAATDGTPAAQSGQPETPAEPVANTEPATATEKPPELSNDDLWNKYFNKK